MISHSGREGRIMSNDSALHAAARITVVIVEDDALYRDLLCDICRRAPQLQLLAVCASAEQARSSVPALDPDIVLVDLELPDDSGADVIRHLRRSTPGSEHLVLTVYDDDRHLFSALEAGAIGYVLKEQSDEATLVNAIQDAARGGAPMSASIARRLLSYFHDRPAHAAESSPELTARENEIMAHLASGHSTRRVAQLLQISYHTVRDHQKNIYKKLHVGSVLEAVAALRRPQPRAVARKKPRARLL